MSGSTLTESRRRRYQPVIDFEQPPKNRSAARFEPALSGWEAISQNRYLRIDCVEQEVLPPPVPSWARLMVERAVEKGAFHKLLAVWRRKTWATGPVHLKWDRSCTGDFWSAISKGAEKSKWEQLREKLSALTKLKKGWDSYDADPPSVAAVRNASEFVRVLETLGAFPDWAEPTSDDSIMLEVKVNDILEEWDFYSDGDVAVLHEWPNGRTECRMVQPTIPQMMAHLLAPAYAPR